MTDKQHLEAMLTALDASPRTLERIGDWQIVGKNGHIMTDGRGFLLYVSTSESPRRWTGIKKRLGFCRLTIEFFRIRTHCSTGLRIWRLIWKARR